MLGLSLSAFTQVHVVLSLVGIITGLVAVLSLFANRMSAAWTGTFLASTALTSMTGFLFPSGAVLPSHIVGVVSLAALALAAFALYARHLRGAWRAAHVAAATLALYLNCFVGVVQGFLKLDLLQSAGSLQGIVQGLLFVGFLVLGFRASQRSRPA